MARIVNYSSLSKLAKRRVAEAGYTPDPGGKTASRKSSSGSSIQKVKEEQLQTYTAQMEAPVQTPTMPEKRYVSGTAGSPAGDIKQQFKQGDIDLAEANRRIQALKKADTDRTKQEESFRAQEKRIDKITKTEEKLYKADQWVEGKVKKVISGKGYVSGVGTAAAMLPYRMTAGFGGDVYVAGMKTAAASEGLVKNTSGTLKSAGSAAVQTPRVVASGFDPRKPEGLVNIATVAALTRAGKGYKPRFGKGKGVVTDEFSIKTGKGQEARMTRTETKKAIIEEGYKKSSSGQTETFKRVTPKPQEPVVPFRKRASEGFRKAGERVRTSGRDAANMFKDTARNIKDRFKAKPKDRVKASKDLQKVNRDIGRLRPEKAKWLVPRKNLIVPRRPSKNPIVPRRPSYPITRPNRPPQFDITFNPSGGLVPKKPKVPDVIKPKDIIKPKPDERIYRRVDKPVDKPKPSGGGGLPPFGSFGLDLGGGGGLNPTWRSRKGGKRSRAKSYLPSQAALTFNIRGKRAGTGTGLEFRPITTK
jgi:hypothetical protein